MTIAHVDMIGGAAGDMLLGAWIDAGLDAAALERALRSIVAEGWDLVTERVERGGLTATYVDLVIPGEDLRAHEPGGTHHHRGGARRRLRDIIAIVERSGLSPLAIERASAVYRRLAEAEARAEGTGADEIVFHRAGQIDAILDVAGTCVALEWFGIEELYVSAFPFGTGHSHGHSNPGPVVLDLVRGFATRTVDVEAQLVTGTAAAILSTLATPGPAPGMTVERAGYGAGHDSFAVPNVLRVTIGERRNGAGGRP